MSPATKPTITITGMYPVRRSRKRSPFLEMSEAKYIMVVTLASSVGCMLRVPTFNQLLAPLILLVKGTIINRAIAKRNTGTNNFLYFS
ncbi:hypothetical protein D3C76_1043420 [compost metagenome]